MDAKDERPIVTDRDADAPDDDSRTPLPPWMRRFASVVGFAGGDAGPGGNSAFS